jgi:hypothetical protein
VHLWVLIRVSRIACESGSAAEKTNNIAQLDKWPELPHSVIFPRSEQLNSGLRTANMHYRTIIVSSVKVLIIAIGSRS